MEQATVTPGNLECCSAFCLQACLLRLHSLRCLLSSCLLVAPAQFAVSLVSCLLVATAQCAVSLVFMLACCICTLCSPQKTDCLPKSECCPTQLNTWVPTYASWLPLHAYTAGDWLSCMGTYTPCTPGWTQSKGTCSNLPTGACRSPL